MYSVHVYDNRYRLNYIIKLLGHPYEPAYQGAIAAIVTISYSEILFQRLDFTLLYCDNELISFNLNA